MRKPTIWALCPVMLIPVGDAFAQQTIGSPMLEEIVVTAQKRSEDLQSVPISIAAFSGEDLRKQGVVDIKDLGNVVPGVQVSDGVLGPQINIRGVTSSNSTEVGDPAVAFHVDGVYYGRPRSMSATFYDIERVEVLRGPQGTLYGRNATAGTVNLITHKPTRELEGSAAVETGNYNLISTTAALNVPVSDSFALRGAVHTYRHDGYTDNAPGRDANDSDIRAGRLHMLWTPADELSVLLSADTFRNPHVGGATVPLPVEGDLRSFPVDNTFGYQSNEQEQDGISLTADWEIGFGSLTYIAARREDETISAGPSSTSSTPADVALEQTQVSHELRLTGDTESLQWQAGVYYYDEDQSVDVLIPQGPILLGFVQDPVKATSTGVFTQNTWSMTPELRLTVGLRYSKDEKSRTGGVFINGFLVSPNIADEDWSKTSYRVAVDWDVSPDSLLYASVATGYKAGGYMDGVPPNDYGPENLLAFEVGSKNRLADDRLQLNLSAFYYDYEDYQVSYLGLLFPDLPDSPTVTRTSNAGKAVNYGAELEVLWALSEQGRFNLGASWLHTEFEELRQEFVDVFGREDYSGNRLVGAPEVTANAGYEHNWVLANAGTFTARGQLHYTSSSHLDYRNFDLTKQDGYTTVNASLAFRTMDERWTVELWGRNLTDKDYYVSAAPDTRPPNPNAGTALLATPRTYGVRVGMEF